MYYFSTYSSLLYTLIIIAYINNEFLCSNWIHKSFQNTTYSIYSFQRQIVVLSKFEWVLWILKNPGNTKYLNKTADNLAWRQQIWISANVIPIHMSVSLNVTLPNHLHHYCTWPIQYKYCDMVFQSITQASVIYLYKVIQYCLSRKFRYSRLTYL